MDFGTSNDNVVSLAARRPVAPGALRAVEAYWQTLADGRLVPWRSEVDPRGLSGTLDRVFLLERIAPRHARFRVAGSRLGRLLDMDLRGMPISALFHPAARPDLAEALAAVFAEPARLHLRLDGAGGRMSATRLAAELLILPLRDDAGEITRALGVIDWQGEASAPTRFRIGHQQRRTLIGYGERPGEEDHNRPLPLVTMRDDADTPAPRQRRPDPGKRPTFTIVT